MFLPELSPIKALKHVGGIQEWWSDEKFCGNRILNRRSSRQYSNTPLFQHSSASRLRKLSEVTS